MDLWELSEPLPRNLALLTLAAKLDPARENPLLLESMLAYAGSEAHKIVVVTDRAEPTVADARGLALVTFYEMPMSATHALVVEGAWCDSGEAAGAMAKWLIAWAVRMEFPLLCIPPAGVVPADALHDLLEASSGLGFPVGRRQPYLQSAAVGLYSSLAGGPTPPSVFQADCWVIGTEIISETEFAGVELTGDAPLYRGEGRLQNGEGWSFPTYEHLARHVVSVGFPARAPGAYGGTLQEQILQQGYVDQPTVSLSSSFEVTAYYATNGHKGAGGVVFTIDPGLLRQRGPIFDSMASMRQSCHWFFEGEFDTLAQLVHALGVLDAGRLLERWYQEARRRVETGRTGSFRVDPPLAETLSPEQSAAVSGSVDPKGLASLDNAFDQYWMFASGEVGSIDTLHVEGGELKETTTRTAGPMFYQLAFDRVRDRLEAALDGATADHRHLGWDLTAFGYIAKTCRDREFFSAGDVPPECIVKATLVDRDGGATEVIRRTPGQPAA